MRKSLLLCTILFVAACNIEPSPAVWPPELNPYMEEKGYTLSQDGVTILKNGYPVWFDEPCLGRRCFDSNRPLVPRELANEVSEGIREAVRESREQYVIDISRRIGVEYTIPDATEEMK
jgi:hypothetical protein